MIKPSRAKEKWVSLLLNLNKKKKMFCNYQFEKHFDVVKLN